MINLQDVSAKKYYSFRPLKIKQTLDCFFLPFSAWIIKASADDFVWKKNMLTVHQSEAWCLSLSLFLRILLAFKKNQ